MTNKEIIEMLLAQKSQIDGHIARIMAKDELEAPIDPYAELKAAHAAGKRIAYKTIAGDLDGSWTYLSSPEWSYAVEDYKIVEDDKVQICIVSIFGEDVKTKYTKCALTGKITAEVVE